MTNSEKIKAYLDAGHKVKFYSNKHECIIFSYELDEDDRKILFFGRNTGSDRETNKIIFLVSYYIDDDYYGIYDVSLCIHQEPLRYPNVGDKVVILESARLQGFGKNVGEACIVAENHHYGCSIFIETTNNKHLIDYRHLAPYIE